jgi:hypothetical protein
MVLQTNNLQIWDWIKITVSYALLSLALVYLVIAGILLSPVILVWIAIRFYVIPLLFQSPPKAHFMPSLMGEPSR